MFAVNLSPSNTGSEKRWRPCLLVGLTLNIQLGLSNASLSTNGTSSGSKIVSEGSLMLVNCVMVLEVKFVKDVVDGCLQLEPCLGHLAQVICVNARDRLFK